MKSHDLTHLFEGFREYVQWRVCETSLYGFFDPVVNIDGVGGGRSQVFIINLLNCG